MIRRIKELVPKQVVLLEHKGMLNGGKTIMTGEDVAVFKGATEEYSFYRNSQFTTMLVDTDVLIKSSSFFIET